MGIRRPVTTPLPSDKPDLRRGGGRRQCPYSLCGWRVQERLLYPCLPDLKLQPHPTAGALPPKDSPTMGEPQPGVSLPTKHLGATAANQEPVRKAGPQHFYNIYT